MRSTVAHARVVSIEVDEAAAASGVVAVFTAGDLPMLPIWEIELIPEALAQPPLATGIVRYAGERVAAVVARSLAAALDAVERVVVEYEPLPVLTDPTAATEPSSPVLFPEHGSNVALHWPADPSAAPFDPAAVVVRAELRIPRVCVAPMEGHAILAVPDGDGLTAWVSTQVPHPTRVQLARSLQLPVDRIRVVAPHVGGGFGGKATGGIAEHVVTAAAALRLGRPVQYVEDRAANLAGMQGRGVVLRSEAAATRDGRLVGLRVEEICDAGAYPSTGAVEPGKTRLMACGPYRVPTVEFTARAVMTNRAPTGAYRGPGRAEAAAVLERTMDLLAGDLGLDPIEVRRRNLVGPEEFPFTTATGVRYDSGDYARLLDVLVAKTGYDGLRREQRLRRSTGSGSLLGIGVALVVDSTAWFARRQTASVEIRADGIVEIRSGTASAGQQHDVALSTIAREVLQVAPDRVEVIEADTARTPVADGTMGSRSTQLAGTAVRQASEIVLSKIRRAAAKLLEAAPDDVVFHDGRLGVRGVPARTVSLGELAVDAVLDDDNGGLAAQCVFEQADAAYPSAAHLSVVDVDAETGRVTPVRHVAVTDCGRVIDAPSADGQVVGASVQGIGQALLECAAHADDGTPLATSLAEYLVPSAAEVPAVETHWVSTPSPRNPLGAKGVGEIGMIAAPAAVHNAVLDAVAHLGVRHLDLPCTPEVVWRALRAGRRAPP